MGVFACSNNEKEKIFMIILNLTNEFLALGSKKALNL
jgi:hypothetical protein